MPKDRDPTSPCSFLPFFFFRLRRASRSHFAHSQLWCLAFGPDRERYEELRAAYNPVRPAGCPPAPPFEDWRGMSDICDHAYCRCTNYICCHVHVPRCWWWWFCYYSLHVCFMGAVSSLDDPIIMPNVLLVRLSKSKTYSTTFLG